jgi:hypothetical protein
MDAMAMALHCVYTTNSFKKAMLKCANLRGDSDTVCAVAGQIAGAIYGWKSIPNSWYQAISKWDTNDHIFLRVYKMYYFNHTQNTVPENTGISNQKENIDQNIVPLEDYTNIKPTTSPTAKPTHNSSNSITGMPMAGSIHLIDGNNYLFVKNGMMHIPSSPSKRNIRNSSPAEPTGGRSSTETHVPTQSNSAVYNTTSGDIVTLSGVNNKEPASYNIGNKNSLTKTSSKNSLTKTSSLPRSSSNGKNTGGTNGQPKKKFGCTLL